MSLNFNQIIALILIGLLATGLLGRWVLIPVGILVLLVLIRLLADIYWAFKGGDDYE
jgi:hypothetical protein